MQAESIMVPDNLKQPERFLEIAYHEAAHCVIPFLFKEHLRITCIDMMFTDSTPCVSFDTHHGNIGQDFWHLKREIVGLLAGPAAQAKKAGEACKIGADLMLFICKKIISPTRGSMDFLNAVRITDTYLMGRTGRDVPLSSKAGEPTRGDGTVYRVLIKRFCGWAVELMECPGVWHVVSALADRLEPETVMPGQAAWKIMHDAWSEFLGNPNWENSADEDIAWPIATLGNKWSRRLL